jgi:hypothetical protein
LNSCDASSNAACGFRLLKADFILFIKLPGATGDLRLPFGVDVEGWSASCGEAEGVAGLGKVQGDLFSSD